jgi:rRNA maturation protein Nop10
MTRVKLRKCEKCGYTLEEVCKKCGNKTLLANYKFVAKFQKAMQKDE